MPSTLEKLGEWFRIDSTEKPWVFGFVGAIFFISGANTLAWNLLQALLIKRLGVAWLPPFFIASSFAFYIGSWFAIKFLRRMRAMSQSMEMAMLAIPLALAFALTQQYFVKEAGLFVIVAFVGLGLMITTSLLYIGLHKFLNSPADVFNVEQMQRLEPVFASAMQLGALVAGGLAALLSARLDSTSMFLLVPSLLVLAAPFCLFLRNKARASLGSMVIESSNGNGKRKKEASAGSWGLKNLYTDPTLRKFVYLLGAIMALYMVFTRIFSYEFALAANSRYGTESGLNEFIGTYTAILSVVTLVYINTLQRWLFKRYGLTQNLFVPPFLMLLGAAAMFIWPWFFVVVAVVFSREVFIFLQKSSLRFLLSGISDYQRSQAWTWMNGPALTLGNLLGSAFLAGVSYFLADSDPQASIRSVALFAVEFIILQIFITMHVRRTYPKVLLHSLKECDFKTRVRTMEALAEVKHMKDRHLAEILDIVRDADESVMLRVTGLRTLSIIGDPSILRVVTKLLSENDNDLRREAYRTIASFSYTPEQLFDLGFSRQTLLAKLRAAYATETVSEAKGEILTALISLRDPEIVPFLLGLLEQGPEEIRISCLHSLRNFHDPGIIDAVRPYMDSSSEKIVAMAIKALWQFEWERHLMQGTFEKMLNAPRDSKAEIQGLYLIGALHLPMYRDRLVSALERNNRQAALTAAIALLKLGDGLGTSVLEDALRRGDAQEAYEVMRLVYHPDVSASERKRIDALIHLNHLHYPEHLPVTEPLRVRLCEIPKECLTDLRTKYTRAQDASEMDKIKKALENKSNASIVKGGVALVGLDADWQEMATVALLAHGYRVRTINEVSELAKGEILVGFEEVGGLNQNAVILTSDIDVEESNKVIRTHYAPSKLVAAVERAVTVPTSDEANPFHRDPNV